MSKVIPLIAPVKGIIFDAVGTLIHAVPSVSEVYYAIGNKYGSPYDLDEIRRRFGQVYAARQTTLTTNEDQEDAFWRDVVSQVLGSVVDFEQCYCELHQHFAKPSSWRLMPETTAALTSLRIHFPEIKVAVGSNFDSRLHTVMDGHQELASISLRFISSEIGWRKPSSHFFNHVCEVMELPPQEVLMVGDDLTNDVEGARAIGIQTLLVSHEANSTGSDCPRIQSLAQLLEYLPH